MLRLKAVDILALGISATLAMATVPVTLTLTTTVTECAASCSSTGYATTHIIPAYSTSVVNSYNLPRGPCTDHPSCSYAATHPPSYTAPEEVGSSDSSLSSGSATPVVSSPTAQPYSGTSPPMYDGVASPSDYRPSETPSSTQTPPLPSTWSGYVYPSPSPESSVDATETSLQPSTPTTLATSTRDRGGSDRTSRTQGPPPPMYGTPTDEPPPYDDPPSYTELPSYGETKVRAA